MKTKIEFLLKYSGIVVSALFYLGYKIYKFMEKIYDYGKCQ